MSGSVAITQLLERDGVLSRIDALRDDASAGHGSALLVEGVAGVGKTALLKVACARGREAGARVLAARGGELEREIAFGVCRQLFERAVLDGGEDLLGGAATHARAAVGAGSTGDETDPFAVLHGLYWLCSNLADRGPLVLAIDDAHWADPQSLRWLEYLSHRLDDLPVLALVAARPAEPAAELASLASLVGDRTAELVTLAPLGEVAVAELVRASLEESADDSFCTACHRATGGNPFLLRELLGSLREDSIAPVATEAPAIDQLAPDTVARSVETRLARLGEDATAIARTVALLGTGTRLRHAAALAGLDGRRAATATDALRAADILAPQETLDFVHPLVRAAVYRGMAPSARAEGHRQAAGVLHDDGERAEIVAAHLLASEPASEEWTVDRLRAAARQALEAGAPDAAAAHLTRAMAEPPPAGARAAVLLELGMATFPLDPSVAVEHLRDALGLAEAAGERASIALALAKASAFSDRPAESVEVLEQVLAELGDDHPELAIRVERELLGWAHFWTRDEHRAEHSERLRRLAAPLPGASIDERMALGLFAWDLVVGETPAAEVLEVANRAVGQGITFVDPAQGFEVPTLIASTFMFCDRFDRALELFDHGVGEMRARGWLVHLAFTHSHRAHVQLRRGLLLEAEAEARTSWELAAQLGPRFPAWWYAFSNLVQVLVARGETGEAHTIWEASGIGDTVPDAVIYPLPRVVLGELKVARGELQAGAEDLLSAGAWLDERGFTSPSWSPWRMIAVPALAALGREDEGRPIAAVAVERSRRIGSAWALGRALRAAATCEERDAAIDLLGRSVDALEGSSARYELAASLLELGAALRRAKRRVDSRDPLRRALDLAHRCGARAIEARAVEELAATGARPRNVMLTGVESLTPSELRVCRLAAEGRSNPEIAQVLCVTRKTVETHLASSYRKLDVPGRSELPRVLAEAG